MATVCGLSSLMDAGVPIKTSWYSYGINKRKKKFILSDILGDEDHLGDMDFKVAGTKDGITSLQMNIKITYNTGDIKETEQAKKGRIHILNEMTKAIDKARETVNSNAPRIEAY